MVNSFSNSIQFLIHLIFVIVVVDGRTRIFLALTKVDKLLSTLEDQHEQVAHINSPSSRDVRDIFVKQIVYDVKNHFGKWFPTNQIVFTCSYTEGSPRRDDFDALNSLALQEIILACE
eukprot:c7566_g1_i1.p2 GENE.c7566_g1_i1~~c7566_g1_i1.p2  ORF type:complete len:118 (+),score=19.07 c7566_g1_i1:1007-1360(+)